MNTCIKTPTIEIDEHQWIQCFGSTPNCAQKISFMAWSVENRPRLLPPPIPTDTLESIYYAKSQGENQCKTTKRSIEGPSSLVD
jgi:hypothetical protein